MASALARRNPVKYSPFAAPGSNPVLSSSSSPELAADFNALQDTVVTFGGPEAAEALSGDIW